MASDPVSFTTMGKIVVGIFILTGALVALVIERALGYDGMMWGAIFGGAGGGIGGVVGAIVAQIAGLTWRSGR